VRLPWKTQKKLSLPVLRGTPYRAKARCGTLKKQPVGLARQTGERKNPFFGGFLKPPKNEQKNSLFPSCAALLTGQKPVVEH